MPHVRRSQNLDRLARSLQDLITIVGELRRPGASGFGPSTKRWTPPSPPTARRAGNSVASIARLLGVSPSTLYKHVPELTAGRPQSTEVEAAP
ncbi:hypothetical protein GCM10027290_04380 [Micromonospora sonneratiae]|uniref:Helix-turn-helix domain of resolvase n=1 Tax=Micromonospora sonneratiae TaxID=1184706 RepID=A0ABW3YIF0_9ACTN